MNKTGIIEIKKTSGRFLHLSVMSLICCIALAACTPPDSENRPNPQSGIWNPPMGQDAPPEAFFHGDTLAYFGADSPWNLRFFYGYFDEWENRRGQRMMLDIMNNKFIDAEHYTRDVLERFPGELEALFNLSVALAHQGRVDEAMETVRESVDQGLPFVRYLAGPRSVLKPLAESAAFIEYAAGFDSPLLHGPMVGQITTTAAAFWVRTHRESRIQVRVSRNPDMSGYRISNPGRTSADTDYTAIVSVEGLEPDSRYYYRVFVDGREISIPQELTFKTYPEAGQGASFSMVFGGCSAYYPENERLWDVIHGKSPLAYLTLGDNMYFNMLEHANHPHAMQHYTYYQRQSREEYKRLVATTPVYAIWDDHEFTDDVWLGPYRHKPHWKMPLFEQYRQNWINPSYGSEEWPGVWHSFSIGDVDVFMLDGRFYRTNPYAKEPSRVNDFAPYPTMLGPVQKAWLFEQLKQSAATFKVIVSPVPWAYHAKPGSVDTWYGFREERDEIFGFLTEQEIGGVVLLSSDRHRSDAWEIERNGDYPMYEFASGRLTNKHRHNTVPEALFSYNDKESFGLLKFDFEGDDPSITYQIFSIDDELVYELELNRSELSASGR